MPIGPWTKNPRVRSVEILVWLYRERSDRFTIREIMQRFDMARSDARQRVIYMIHLWGAAKEIGRRPAHRRGRREVEYALTKWGLKYAAAAMKRVGRRVAANPRRQK